MGVGVKLVSCTVFHSKKEGRKNRKKDNKEKWEEISGNKKCKKEKYKEVKKH